METLVVAMIVLLPSNSIAKPQSHILDMDNEASIETIGLISARRDIMQTEQMSAVAPETRERSQCPAVALGASVNITSGTLLVSFTTPDAFVCCEACEANDECTTWRRNRADGLCDLFRAEATSAQIDSDTFDAGGFLATARAQSSGARFGADISSETLSSCRISRGITYPNGAVVARGSANSAVDCCNLCRFSNNCRSWFYDRRSRICVQNSNIPSEQNRDSSRFRGGTV